MGFSFVQNEASPFQLEGRMLTVTAIPWPIPLSLRYILFPSAPCCALGYGPLWTWSWQGSLWKGKRERLGGLPPSPLCCCPLLMTASLHNLGLLPGASSTVQFSLGSSNTTVSPYPFSCRGVATSWVPHIPCLVLCCSFLTKTENNLFSFCWDPAGTS
jgi:hypothetical protein